MNKFKSGSSVLRYPRSWFDPLGVWKTHNEMDSAHPLIRGDASSHLSAGNELAPTTKNSPQRETPPSVDAALDQIVRSDLVRATQDFERAFLFKHALIQDTAYESLLKQERKHLHRVVAASIEELFPQQANENAARLAEHYWLAEEWGRAADFSLRAGTSALRLYALREAISHFERAQTALEKISGAPFENKIDAILGWAQAAFRFRPYPEQLERLAVAERLAREMDDRVRLAQVLYRAGSVHMASGHNLRAAPLLAECFALAHELGDEQLTVLPTFFMGSVLMDSDPRGALDLFDRAIELAEKHHNVDTEAAALGMKAMTEARLGESENARRDLERALATLKDVKSPMTESDVLLYAAWSYLDMGDTARGLEFGQRGVDKALASENMDCVCYGFSCVGFANLQSQNVTQARDSFQESIRRSNFSGAVQVENLAQAGLAMARIFGGDAAALGALEQAYQDALGIGNQFAGALVAQTLGGIYLQQGNGLQAKQYLDAAFDYFTRTGLGPYLARAQQAQQQLAALLPA